MLYTTVLLIIFLLGIGAFLTWLRRGLPSNRSAEVAIRKASELLALKRCDQALVLLSPLEQRRRLCLRTRILYCQALNGLGQYADALSGVEEALEGHPNHLALLQQKGRALLGLGDASQARGLLERCLPVLNGEDAIVDLATARFRMGDVQGSWALIKDLVDFSQSGRLFALAGDCHYFLESYRTSLSFYLKARHCGWQTHRSVTRMATCYLQTGHHELAERQYWRILSHDSTDILSTLGLGRCLEARGQYHEALRIYQSGHAWERGDDLLLEQAGICAIHSKDYRYAEVYLTAVAERGSASPRALVYLAYSLECQRKWAAAEVVYWDLLKRYPDHLAGYRGLTWLFGVGHSRHLDADEALSMAQHLVAVSTDSVSWELLSACEARAGNYTKAHDIQEQLSVAELDSTSQRRRREAMRSLRQCQPLDAQHVCRALVA